MKSSRLNNLREGLSLDRLVAHRGYPGYPANAPENTISALRAALEIGARFIEFDVQMTADGVPVVFHDEHLQRITGDHRRIIDLNLSDLPRISGMENHARHCIPTVSEAAAFLRDWPSALAFVELKPASIEQFGGEFLVEKTLDALQPVMGQCIIISYDLEALELARSLVGCDIGWVLRSWSDEAYEEAVQLHPEYLFFDHLRIPSPVTHLWTGPWRWVMYEIDTFERAQCALSLGADLLETMHLARLMKHQPPLEQGKLSA